VLRILNTCVKDFSVVPLWFDQSEFKSVLMLFNLLTGPGFIFESCS